jgi:hypothetical protein
MNFLREALHHGVVDLNFGLQIRAWPAIAEPILKSSFWMDFRRRSNLGVRTEGTSKADGRNQFVDRAIGVNPGIRFGESRTSGRLVSPVSPRSVEIDMIELRIQEPRKDGL